MLLDITHLMLTPWKYRVMLGFLHSTVPYTEVMLTVTSKKMLSVPSVPQHLG